MAWKGETIIIIQRKRKSKKGVITFAVTSLSAIAIVATGFSAWVISATSQKDITGNITVDTVDNRVYAIKNLTIDGTSIADNVGSATTIIRYGKPSSDTLADSSYPTWLKNDSTDYEKLTITVSFDVMNKYKDDGENADCVVSATFAEEEVGGKKLYDTLSKETFSYGSSSSLTYVDTVPSVPALSPTQDASDKTIGKYSFTITFKWGSFCNNENPAVYASEQTDVESWTADKKNMYAQALDKVYGVNGAKFKLTITTSSASATTGS